MARNAELDSLGDSDYASASPAGPTQPNPTSFVPHVLKNMMGSNNSYGASSGDPGNSPALTQTAGGWRVNDLNPATQARHPQGFGVSPTRDAALRHLRAIEYFKHHGG